MFDNLYKVVLDTTSSSATFSPFLALIFFLLSLSPFLTSIAAYLTYPQFAVDVWAAALEAFGIFTLINIVLFLVIGSINGQFFYLLAAKILPKINKISLAKDLKLPENKSEFGIFVIFFMLGNTVVAFGLFNALSPKLEKYSLVFKIVLMFIPIIIVLTITLLGLTSFLLLIVAWSSHIMEMCGAAGEESAKECLSLYTHFNENMGPLLLAFFSSSQFAWISCLYNAIVIFSPTHNLNIAATIQLTVGYTAWTVMFLIFLKILTFQLDRQYRALQGLARRLPPGPLKSDLKRTGPVSACGMFNIERSTLTSMVSTALTYLIVLVQFKLSLK